MTTALAHHWQMMLAAAVVGLVLGVASVAAYYLTPIVRLRLAADPARRACVLRAEVARPQRLEDAAAVLGEHGRPGAGELREEAELRNLILQLALRRADRVNPSVRG